MPGIIRAVERHNGKHRSCNRRSRPRTPYVVGLTGLYWGHWLRTIFAHDRTTAGPPVRLQEFSCA